MPRERLQHLFASLRLCARHFGCGHPHERYSEAIFGCMPTSTRKQQNIPPPLKKGGQGGISIGRNSLNPPGPLCKRGRFSGFGKRRRCSGFGEGGNIPRLFSDCMPERISCRQVSENNRTFPPFEKGGSGGISHETHMTVSVTKQDENVYN
jgi:hypothetical protein